MDTSSSSKSVEAFASVLVDEASQAQSLTVGLTNGSRTQNDPRFRNHFMGELSEQIGRNAGDHRTLCIELAEGQQERRNAQARIPVAVRSPLGPWSNVSIPVSRSRKPTWEQTQLPEWLPLWKEAFSLIVVDLGPISSPAARSAGRLCDGCYVVLGPHPCGSQQWILQQVSWHQRIGSIVCGSLIATLESPARSA